MLVRAYIDTNLLLQFKPVTQLDWKALLGASRVELVVIPAILRELEDKKHGEKKRLRKRASAALDLITEHLGDGLCGEVRKDVVLRFMSEEPKVDFPAHGLSRHVVDDWLLATLIEDAGTRPCLVSDDTTLVLKSRARGIRVIRPPDDARLAPEEDEEHKKLSEENRALRKQLAKRPDLTLTFADQKNIIHHDIPAHSGLGTSDRRKAVESRRVELLAEAQQRMAMRRGVRFGPEFDAGELDKYLDDLSVYLSERDAYDDLVRRSVTVALRLSNRGPAPATGIEIYLRFPDGTTIGESMGRDEPEEPPLPRFFRSPFETSGSSHIDKFVRASLGSPKQRAGWRLLQDERTLHISLNELVHTLSTLLDPFWVAFPIVNGRPKGFEVECSLLVARPPEEFGATLSPLCQRS